MSEPTTAEADPHSMFVPEFDPVPVGKFSLKTVEKLENDPLRLLEVYRSDVLLLKPWAEKLNVASPFEWVESLSLQEFSEFRKKDKSPMSVVLKAEADLWAKKVKLSDHVRQFCVIRAQAVGWVKRLAIEPLSPVALTHWLLSLPDALLPAPEQVKLRSVKTRRSDQAGAALAELLDLLTSEKTKQQLRVELEKLKVELHDNRVTTDVAAEGLVAKLCVMEVLGDSAAFMAVKVKEWLKLATQRTYYGDLESTLTEMKTHNEWDSETVVAAFKEGHTLWKLSFTQNHKKRPFTPDFRSQGNQQGSRHGKGKWRSRDKAERRDVESKEVKGKPNNSKDQYKKTLEK